LSDVAVRRVPQQFEDELSALEEEQAQADQQDEQDGEEQQDPNGDGVPQVR